MIDNEKSEAIKKDLEDVMEKHGVTVLRVFGYVGPASRDGAIHFELGDGKVYIWGYDPA